MDSILGVSQGKCASDKTKQKLGALSFISQKSRTTISAVALQSPPLLNSILSSYYYPAMSHFQYKFNTSVRIQYTCLSFQIDSPMQLNAYGIKQPPFTCPNSSRKLQVHLN